MPARPQLHTLGLLFAATLAACGGGSSDAPPPPAPPTTVEFSGRVVDGPLQGAIACYDLNDNQRCDSGDPRSAAASDAAGRFTITIPAAEAGRHQTIVEVPATAIDADTGAAVGSSFTLVAPAGAASDVFVSPLSTLVVQQMNASGQTLAQARDHVQAQAGLALSPLADFTAGTSADHAKAANAAKLVLQATLQQQAAVTAAVGQPDVSGATIAAADLERAVQGKVIEALPAIGVAAADPALVGLTGTARELALTAAAGQVVAGIGFTPEQARFVIGIPKLPQTPQAAPEAGAAMVALQYTDSSNWFFRYNAATAADSTPDGNGRLHYYSVRTRMAPYAFEPTQGVAESFARTVNPELHWSGSAWTACTLTDRSSQTPRDALGRSAYDFCRNIEKGTSQRGEIDIAGQTLASVWTDRILVEQAKTNNPAAWALPNTALLGSAVFPAGSRLVLQTNAVTETAVTYNTSDGNRVGVSPLDQAQGGDARSGSPVCATTFTSAPATSLEQLVERYPGRPCLFNAQTDANGTSLNPNEVWGISSVSLGTLATNVERPAGTANYYTTNRLLRASFPSAGNVLYWSCLQRTTNNAARNCTQIGSGTYTIGTLGDARTMSFNNLPVAAQALASTRVFVERGGAVYFGFKNRVGAVNNTVRLNLAAANALLYQLGMPAILPVDAPKPLSGAKAANAALLNGVWAMADANGAAVLRFGADGGYLMAQATPPDAAGRPGIEEGYVDFDLAAAQQLGLVTNVDSNHQWGLSHPQPNDRITSITTDAITLGDGTVINRLQDDANGIVGMWALSSASDLKTTHFVFFANGKALSIHPAESEGPCVAARQGPPGVEWSDYSFDAASGVLTFFNKTIDSSGCTGVWDATQAAPPASVSFTLTLAADKKSFTVPVDGGASVLTAHRIAPRP